MVKRRLVKIRQKKYGNLVIGKDIKFLPIYANLDEYGRTLTYSVKIGKGKELEFNTLREAKIIAGKVLN